ncbi:ribosome biogenesis GTPase YlqF [Candidatus Phytoplasma melaleucae]|uniref:Ribosome biogenesis GTPase A n=1 Tax=Candidatus Phytoplasma melaleucae TaxID=2982630 RepID=A0ABT9DCL1_9MOLU|nr:ribosome biogenesis GTPase YlqF ['Melaleuca sp.' phytoplasma]MDO8167877.1 ribosome biogenesis GTPase YlqF ['Melaleuca sp.' phytoplasma]MDV3205216.1 ribosome biogenesis GTPase YlqF [Weeping tea tree witches'-broom phytoplasma]
MINDGYLMMDCIKWFPDHMKETLKQIQNNLKLVDLILIVLDARIPFSSMNFELLKVLNNKSVLLLLNKVSLADMKKICIFTNFMRQKQIPTLPIDAKHKNNIDKIYPYIRQILKLKNPNFNKLTLKLMIVGVPNVGKSTLINCLSRRKVVKTANIPGITKRLQWINLNNKIRLLDTPGVLNYKLNTPEMSYALAICGCIKSTLFLKEPIINYSLTYLKKHYYQNLKKCFQLTDEDLQGDNLLNVIKKKNRYLSKNNVPDENKVLDMILHKISNKEIDKVNFDLDLSL